MRFICCLPALSSPCASNAPNLLPLSHQPRLLLARVYMKRLGTRVCGGARAGALFVGFASLCLVLFSPESGSASVGPSSSSGPIIFIRAASRRQFRQLACDLHASGCAWARLTACQCSVLDISLLSSHQPPPPAPCLSLGDKAATHFIWPYRSRLQAVSSCHSSF